MAETVGGPGSILVVDDEAAMGRLLTQWLSSEGYQMAYATDFAAVRQAMQGTPFDLVTLDIIMPEVSGLEILEWLHGQYPETGVIMATALDGVEVVIEALRQGAIDYLLKPFNLELLSQQIARAMERQRLVADNRRYQQELERLVAARTRALQEAQARLERQVRELEGRDRLVRFQLEAHTREEAYGEIFAALQQVFGSDWAVLYGPVAAGARFEAVASLGRPPLPAAAREVLLTRAFTERRLACGHDPAGVAVPILYQDQGLGVLLVDCPAAAAEQEETLNRLWRLAAEIALTWQGAVVAEELQNGSLASLQALANSV